LQYFSLDLPRDRLDALQAVLAPEERERAARFLSPQHADRFTAAHGVMRQVLAELLDQPPALLQFERQEHGKPRLAGMAAGRGLAFNLSHSGGWALLGWSWQGEIGVDVELWRTMSDEAALVRRFFSAAENATYNALPDAQRRRGFFECWTRKEAYIKAVGRGLGLPLDSFDVSFGEAAPARLLRASSAVDDARAWALAAVDVGPDASAAVVLEGDACHILPAN
jgi:4'-phosphopantetheinyl transferase